jgi:hypothetical protein
MLLKNRKEKYGNKFCEKLKDEMLCANALSRIRVAAERGLASTRYVALAPLSPPPIVLYHWCATHINTHRYSNELRGFEGTPLTPAEFARALHIHFNVKLTPSELRACIHEFDRNGDGHIDFMEVSKGTAVPVQGKPRGL